MSRSTPSILPRLARLLRDLGDNTRKARLRRAYSAETVAQRAGISRKTLFRVERGDPAVALGIYARVLQALGLENDFAAIARDDALGRKLQDSKLEVRLRAPRRRTSADPPSSAPAPAKKNPESP